MFFSIQKIIEIVDAEHLQFVEESEGVGSNRAQQCHVIFLRVEFQDEVGYVVDDIADEDVRSPVFVAQIVVEFLSAMDTSAVVDFQVEADVCNAEDGHGREGVLFIEVELEGKQKVVLGDQVLL